MKQQANTPRSLYVSTKSNTLQRAVDGLHARAVALIARSKSFVSSSDTPQQQQSSSGTISLKNTLSRSIQHHPFWFRPDEQFMF
jgi:hypothetical protein